MSDAAAAVVVVFDSATECSWRGGATILFSAFVTKGRFVTIVVVVVVVVVDVAVVVAVVIEPSLLLWLLLLLL